MQKECGYKDTPWSNAGFDITGKYEGVHSEKYCVGPDYPSSLDLIAGHSPLLQLVALSQKETFRWIETRVQWKQGRSWGFIWKGCRKDAERMQKGCRKDVDTYIRAIESKDWTLGHHKINCLARIANLEIVVHPEEYESATRCKIMYTYNSLASRRNITIFRSVEWSVAKVSSVIKEEAEVNHPVAMVTIWATTMAVTRSKVRGGEAELIIPSELAPKVDRNTIEKRPYNPA
jgi:hypothetical protein